MEIWKEVQGYEGYYEVSNLGNVRSVDRVVSSGAFCIGNPISKYIKKTNGYVYVTLRRSLQKRNFKVHQLVAYAFLGLPKEGEEIDHINTNKTDNKLENLRYVIHSENVRNPITRLNMSIGQTKGSSQRGKFGALHPAARPIIGKNAKGEIVRYNAICEAKEDGFLPKNITAVLCGIRPHHKGYVFSYAE